MSRHQAYRNYDYENDIDEYDGGNYEEEVGGQEELSPEDRAQMIQGTAEIQSALGSQADKVTTQQIQDALWYYYFDVDKSIAYLVSKYIDPQPKQEAKSKAQKRTPPTSEAGKKTASNTPKSKKKGETEGLAKDMNALHVADTPLPKSKHLDVLSEYDKSKKKKSASFVVVGHVDAGKSTMMGRLLLDLHVVDQRTLEKHRKEAATIGKSSFALAWIMDERTDERDHGVTIDIATKSFETDAAALTIIDAPGHRDFVPNMITGASQADFVVLVVDATTGEFEAGLDGQTRDHMRVIRSMGISRIIVAVNKLDTVRWDKHRFDEISQQISGLLTATHIMLKNVSFVPVSGLHGDNLVKRSTEPAAKWYTGPTLVEELENSEPLARPLKKPLRMAVSDVYSTTLSPLAVAGYLGAGSIQAGDALLVQPSGQTAYVKSLERDGAPADWAVAGQNAVVHLVQIDPDNVHGGDIICSPSDPIACTDTLTMIILAFDRIWPMPVEIHRGRLNEAGRIVELVALLNGRTGEVTKEHPATIKAGRVARVVVRMVGGLKVPLEKGQRIVLRKDGETVAAGLLE